MASFYEIRNGEKVVSAAKIDKPEMCFYEYNDEKYFTKNRNLTIVLMIKNSYKKYENAERILKKAQLLEYLKFLNDVGFKNKVKKVKGGYHVFLEEKDYFSKGHVRAALDFIRGAYELGVNSQIKKFMKFKKKFEEHEFFKDFMFEAFQIILIAVGNHGGHLFPCCRNGSWTGNPSAEKFADIETIMKFPIIKKESLTEIKSHSSWALWDNAQIPDEKKKKLIEAALKIINERNSLIS
jgi:hypothetical protein